MGAWCLRCEQLGKTPKDCHLNYHPTRNFKAISRHFNRYHSDLKTSAEQDQQGETPNLSKQLSHNSNQTSTADNPTVSPPVARTTRRSTRRTPVAAAAAPTPAESVVEKRSIQEVTTTDIPSSPAASKRSRHELEEAVHDMEPIPVPTTLIPPAHLNNIVDRRVHLQQHRIIHPPTFHACREGRRVVVTEHMLSLPLYRPVGFIDGSVQEDHYHQERIDVYFCIVEKITSANPASSFERLKAMTPTQRAIEYVTQIAELDSADDMMLYLQGGPGYGAPAPVVGLGLDNHSSWAGRALGDYSRIVLLDQRGTGKSSPITKQSLEKKFPNLCTLDDLDLEKTKSLADFVSSHPNESSAVEKAVREATEFLAQFRADNIVQDAEDIKNALLLPDERLVSF